MNENEEEKKMEDQTDLSHPNTFLIEDDELAWSYSTAYSISNIFSKIPQKEDEPQIEDDPDEYLWKPTVNLLIKNK